jgi:hypothetical protein
MSHPNRFFSEVENMKMDPTSRGSQYNITECDATDRRRSSERVCKLRDGTLVCPVKPIKVQAFAVMIRIVAQP